MKKQEKQALGCVTVMSAIGVVVIVAIVAGWGTTVKNVIVLGTKGSDMTGLAKRKPYSPAAGTCLTEAQLKAYLEVCGRIKPAGDKIDDWEAGNRPARLKAAAAGLVADYLRELKAALDDQNMGPSEFAWIGSRVDRTAGTSPSPGGCAQPEQALCDREAERIKATRLGAHARRIAFGFAQD